jgi:Undecaprenyl-phosphate glucose phosphotransferase
MPSLQFARSLHRKKRLHSGVDVSARPRPAWLRTDITRVDSEHLATRLVVAFHRAKAKIADWVRRDALKIGRQTSRRSFVYAIVALDVIAMLSSALAAAIVSPESVGSPASFAILAIFFSLLVTHSLNRCGAYTIEAGRKGPKDLAKLVLILLGALMASTFALHVAGSQIPPGFVLLAWFSASLAGLIAARNLAADICNFWIRHGYLKCRIVIAGAGKDADNLINAFANVEADDIEILGVFDDRRGDRADMASPGLSRIGSFDDLVVFCRIQHIDDIVITLPITNERRLAELLRKYWVLPVNVRICAHNTKIPLAPRSFCHIGGVRMFDIFNRPLGDLDVLAKDILDRGIAALLLVVFSPIMLVIAIAIKLESNGPVLFRQYRYGFNNEEIEVYKFRSLRAELCDAVGSNSVTRSDDRVTVIGRLIRRCSLDELPQLFNVLGGSMALVGPRAHARHSQVGADIFENAVGGYFARHRVKPGLTGWAQVNGYRGRVETVASLSKRLEYDLYYIDRWSIPFDLYVVALTPFAIAFDRNAF